MLAITILDMNLYDNYQNMVRFESQLFAFPWVQHRNFSESCIHNYVCQLIFPHALILK